MTIHIRFDLFVICAATLCVNCGALAQHYPVKPIRAIVPFSAGGGTDTFARVVAAKVSSALNQLLIIENRPGAGGTIGAKLVTQAAPDGYTVLITSSSTHSTGPHFYRNPPYDPIRDFAPIIDLAVAPYVLVIHPSLPARSVKDLINLAKKRPGDLNYASTGIGSLMHLTGELLMREAHISMLHVTYKGGPPAVLDLAAGNISLLFVAYPSVGPLMSSGKLRVLAVTTAKRVTDEKAPKILRDLPALAETFPGFDASQWWGMFAPVGTPFSIVSKLNAETKKAIFSNDVKTRFAAEAAVPVGSTPQEFAAFLKADYDKWGEVVKGLKLPLK